MDTITGLRELALFAGAGGGILGGHLLDWTTVCAVECDPYAASVLVQRQNDNVIEPFPIWNDVCTFDGKPWRGKVDIISGGFPCQDISCAGKGAGIENGHRSGLWREFARTIREIRPQYAFVENSPLLIRRGIEIVLRDLSEMGYDVAWCVLGANDIGAPHERKRIWMLAQSRNADGDDAREEQGVSERESCAESCGISSKGNGGGYGTLSNSASNGRNALELLPKIHRETLRQTSERKPRRANCIQGINRKWWSTEPRMGRVAYGMDNRVDRLRCIGNGQVPLCAATAVVQLKHILNTYLKKEK